MENYRFQRVAPAPAVVEVSGLPMPAPAPQLVAFGRLLRRRRRDLELSQEALAHASGVSAKHIGEIERANKDPRLTTVLKLLPPLGLADDELLALVSAHLQLP